MICAEQTIFFHRKATHVSEKFQMYTKIRKVPEVRQSNAPEEEVVDRTANPCVSLKLSAWRFIRKSGDTVRTFTVTS